MSVLSNDRDGRSDLAVANQADGAVEIFLNADGRRLRCPRACEPEAFAVADFDDRRRAAGEAFTAECADDPDGMPDLAVACLDGDGLLDGALASAGGGTASALLQSCAP